MPNIKSSLIRGKQAFTLWEIRRSPFFDAAWYRTQTGIPETADAAAHYLDGGWRQSDPSPRFSQQQYLQANPDVREADICPLAHYVLHGRREHRNLTPNAARNHYHAYRFRRSLQRSVTAMRDARLIRRNSGARILVIAHVFYEDSAGEIIEYLKNLSPYRWDLVITATEGRDIARIRDAFSAFKPDAQIRVFPNKGFDIAPFLAVLRETDLDRYDLVFKLQSKRHFSREGVIASGMYIRGRDWFLYLFESVLGAGWVHRNVDRLLHDSGTDLIAAENLLQKDYPYKRRMTLAQLEKKGLSLAPDYRFVAGTCYAERAAVLKPLQALPLSEADFAVTERGCFSFAHAMERYLTGVIPAERQYGNRVCRVRLWINGILGRQKLSRMGLRLADDPRFRLDDDFVLRYLEPRMIADYEWTDLPLGQLCVSVRGRRIPLEYCPPYRYLQGEEAQYLAYVQTMRRQDYMRLSQAEYEAEARENGVQRFRALCRELERDGYDPSAPIVVQENNEILDGQHRACWLLHTYGEAQPVRVLKLYAEGKRKPPAPLATEEEARQILAQAMEEAQNGSR